MPDREEREVSNLIAQIKKESLVEDKLPFIAMVISKISSQMDNFKRNSIVIGGNMNIYSNIHVEGTGNVVGSNNVISIDPSQLAKNSG